MPSDFNDRVPEALKQSAEVTISAVKATGVYRNLIIGLVNLAFQSGRISYQNEQFAMPLSTALRGNKF